MKLISVLALFLSFISSNVFAECNVAKVKSIFFSSDKTPDTFVVKIEGKDCNSATKSIEIVTEDEKVIYEYTSPLSDSFGRDITMENAEYVVESVARDNRFSRTNKLPKWEPSDEYYENNAQGIAVEDAYYRMLLTKSWPTFSHQYGYEGFLTIVYDREKNRVVMVTSGSP